MKLKQLLTKTFLVVACLGAGTSAGWAGEKSTIYSKSLSEWAANDIVTTETAGKWLTSTSSDANRGLFIVADKGLMTRTRGNTNIDTGTLLLDRAANSIVTFDAVWNVGDSEGKNGGHAQGYNQFCSIQYGDLLVKCCLDNRSTDYTYTINGKKTSLGAAAGTLLNTDLTIHIVVNSTTNEISEFYIKNGETTLAQFSDLTDENNKFTSGTDYNRVITKSDISGVSSTNDKNYLKSISVQQETQDVETASVTFKYEDTAGNSLTTYKADQVANDIAIGTEISTLISSYNATFFNGESNKYIYSSYVVTGDFTTVQENGNTVTLKFTDYPATSYSVKAQVSGSDLKTLNSGTAFLDGSTIVTWNKYIKEGEQWFKADEATYGKAITSGTNNVAFTATEALDYFFEAESMTLSQQYGYFSNNSDYSGGGGKGVYQNATLTSTSTIPEGLYTIGIGSVTRNNNKDQSYKISYSEDGTSFTETGKTISFTTAAGTAEKFVEKVNIPADAYLRLTEGTGNNAQDYLDYVYVKKSSVAYTVKYMYGEVELKAADATRTATWGATVALTDADMVDIIYSGKTYRYVSDDASTKEIASDGSTVITVNFQSIGSEESITYTLDVPASSADNNKADINSTNASTSANLTSLVGITNNTGGNYGQGDKVGLTVKIPTDAEYNAEHYMSVGFTIAEGYKFTPTTISVKAQPVTTNKTVKFVLTDGVNSVEKTQENLAQGSITTVTGNFSEGTTFTGDVTLKIYCYGATDTYRLGSPITIAGLVDFNDDIKNAIADCKTYEPSAEFATYIDAQSFISAAEVYAAHSAWQIEQAEANGSTDFSKAIMNRTFELHNTNGWTIYGDPSSSATGDNDKYGVVEYGDGWSQYYTGWNGRNVSQLIAGLPAGTYRLTAKVYSWGTNGAPVRLFANRALSTAEEGTDHTPSLDFTVTGNEESIKIGIGGTGNNNDTDNTWGTWGYRVKDFTLTRLAVTATVSSANYATYCSPYALNFDGITGLTAYRAYKSGDVVKFDAVTEVPAREGLLLRGTGTYNVPIIESASAIGNVFVGALKETTIPYAVESDAIYVLKNGTSGVGFYKTTKAFTVRANSAYLPASIAAGVSSAREFIGFDDETNGISNVRLTDGETAAEVYDLQGRRISQPTKGLYIVNGKKVIIK